MHGSAIFHRPPPILPHVGGRERSSRHGSAPSSLSAWVAGHDLVHPARQGYRVVELPEPHVPAEHHAGGPGFHVEPYLVDHALVAVVLLSAREEDEHPARRAYHPAHPGGAVLAQRAVGLGGAVAAGGRFV